MVQPGKLSRVYFKNEVLKLLAAGSVRLTRHARFDHPERHISPAMINRCLEKGSVQTDPVLNMHGNWQAEILRHMAGEQLRVVAALEWEERIIVITAIPL